MKYLSTIMVVLFCSVGHAQKPMVPDTLDLVERIGLSTEPLIEYACNPRADRATCGPKWLESLVYLRLMSGDQRYLDQEKEALDWYEQHISDPGLYFVDHRNLWVHADNATYNQANVCPERSDKVITWSGVTR